MPVVALPRSRRAASRRASVLAGVLTLITAGAALAQGGGSAPDPGTGVPGSPGPGGPITFDDAATPMVPQPGSTESPQPIGWDHVTVWPDGRTVTVYFWSGPEPCFALDHIEVEAVDGTFRITPFTGYRKDAAAIDCIELAVLYSTLVELPESVLGGGLPDLVGEQPVVTEAEVLLPDASLVDPQVQPWERVQVGPDGRSLWVWFTGGATPCYGLSGVELVDADGVPTLLLSTGPTDTLAMCVAIAVQYRTPVAVPDPILLGGLA